MKITEEYNAPEGTRICVTATRLLTNGQVIAYTENFPPDGYAQNRASIVEAFKYRASKEFAEYIANMTVK